MISKIIIQLIIITIFSSEFVELNRVIDGDTVDTSLGRIRLLGINTPERGQRCYNESKAFLSSLLKDKIKIQRDLVNRDKYHRLLRHLFTKSSFANYEMIKNGYAKSYCIFPNSLFCEKFYDAQVKAINNEVGCLWKGSNNTCAIIEQIDRQSESVSIYNLCNKPIQNLIVESDGRAQEIIKKLYPKNRKIISIDFGKFIYLFDDSGLIDFERV